jgi:tripartite-type tricarboxylate transporter receptor subunit TctC
VTTKTLLRCCGACVAAATLPCFAADSAATFPAKPIRVMVGQPPGGGIDVIARALAQKLSENLGHSVIVDNRGGAAGLLAADTVAKATPDGYTALVVSASYAINPSLYKKMPFDPRKDLQPVALIAASPFILLAHPSLKARSVRDLIGQAKAAPKKINYGSGGMGSTGHLAAELFRSMAGVELTHVPYKGTGPAMVDLLGGQLQLLFNSIIQGAPHARSGKLTALAVTSAKRSGVMPELPTIAESGLPGYDFSTWYGFLVTARTPAPIVNKLNAEIAKVLNQPDVRERMAKEGTEPLSSTPAQFATYLDAQITQWQKVVKSSGMQAE